MVAPRQPARLVVDVDVAPAIVEVLEDLLDDDLALEIDVAKRGRREQVAQDVEAARHLLRVQRDLVERVVAAGLGVQRAAQLLDRQVERERARDSGPSRETACARGSATGRSSRASRSASRRARRGRRWRCAGAASRWSAGAARWTGARGRRGRAASRRSNAGRAAFSGPNLQNMNYRRKVNETSRSVFCRRSMGMGVEGAATV